VNRNAAGLERDEEYKRMRQSLCLNFGQIEEDKEETVAAEATQTKRKGGKVNLNGKQKKRKPFAIKRKTKVAKQEKKKVGLRGHRKNQGRGHVTEREGNAGDDSLLWRAKKTDCENYQRVGTGSKTKNWVIRPTNLVAVKGGRKTRTV